MQRHLGGMSIAESRCRREADVERLINPHIYHVALTEWLWALKQQVIAAAQVHDR